MIEIKYSQNNSQQVCFTVRYLIYGGPTID